MGEGVIPGPAKLYVQVNGCRGGADMAKGCVSLEFVKMFSN